MGLDMRLYRETWITGNYNDKNKEKEVIAKQGGETLFYKITTEPFAIRECVISWSNMIALDEWFFNHIQESASGYGSWFVEEEDLEGLLNDIVDILEDKDLSRDKGIKRIIEVFPSFSEEDYNNDEYRGYFFSELERTKNVLENILIESQLWIDFYYERSV